MRVYLKPPSVASLSLTRVTDALIQYKPYDVEIVDSEEQADLVVLHVIGRQDKALEHASRVNDYAVIQYAVRSTLRPETGGWHPLWHNARLVWSYYDLMELCKEDGFKGEFNFYHSPLGVSSEIRRMPVEKEYIVATTGQSYLTESVRECYLAAKGKFVFHLGQELKRDGMICRTGITDDELAGYLSACEYVSGLRRVEGFELPAAEGLVCGARPILFDKPHYRQWFDEFAVFIPEEPREKVIKSLEQIFESSHPVTDAEILAARKRFNWHTIISGFWERLLA